jgi:hypothetical protein
LEEYFEYEKKYIDSIFLISVNHICFYLLGFLVLILCLHIGMLFDYVHLYCIGHCDISTSYTLYGSMEINVKENEITFKPDDPWQNNQEFTVLKTII